MCHRRCPLAAAFAVVLAEVTVSGRGQAKAGDDDAPGAAEERSPEDHGTAPNADGFAPGWLDWSPPPECPGADQIEARIVEWLGRSVPTNERLSVAARVDWNGGAWEIAVVVHLNGRVGERRIQVSRCGDAADFVALAVVLAVDPGFVPPPPEEPPQEARRVEREAEQEAEPGRRLAAPAASPPPAVPLWLTAGAGVALAVGPLPLVSGGPSAHLGLAGQRWRVGLGGTFLLPVSPSIEAAVSPVWFSLAAGRAWGCYVLVPGRWSLSPCASLEAGVLEAGPDPTALEPHSSQFWAAVGLAAEGTLRVASWFQPFLGVEMSVPLTRPQFVLNDATPVYQPPAVGFRGEVGLRFFFELR